MRSARCSLACRRHSAFRLCASACASRGLPTARSACHSPLPRRRRAWASLLDRKEAKRLEPALRAPPHKRSEDFYAGRGKSACETCVGQVLKLPVLLLFSTTPTTSGPPIMPQALPPGTGAAMAINAWTEAWPTQPVKPAVGYTGP